MKAVQSDSIRNSSCAIPIGLMYICACTRECLTPQAVNTPQAYYRMPILYVHCCVYLEGIGQSRSEHLCITLMKTDRDGVGDQRYNNSGTLCGIPSLLDDLDKNVDGRSHAEGVVAVTNFVPVAISRDYDVKLPRGILEGREIKYIVVRAHVTENMCKQYIYMKSLGPSVKVCQ